MAQFKCGRCGQMLDSEELSPCMYCDTLLCNECLPECDCVDDFDDLVDDDREP